jgi:hypothetical protein
MNFHMEIMRVTAHAETHKKDEEACQPQSRAAVIVSDSHESSFASHP